MDCYRVLVYLALCAVWHVGPSLGQLQIDTNPHVGPTHGKSQIDMNVLARLENLEHQVSGQQYQLEVQNKLIADLQTRVTNQESASAKQQATIDEQQSIIADQQKTILKQKNGMSKLKHRFFDQHRRLTRLEETALVQRTDNGTRTSYKIDVGDAHDEPVKTASDQDKLQDHDTTKNIQRLKKRLVLEGGSMVAFHAVNTGGEISHVGIGQKIMFPTVHLNLGSGYHNQHGIFIAPVAGFYVFSTSLMSYKNDHSEVMGSVMKNGAVLARAYAHGDSGRDDQGSVTLITQLAIGDEVWVSEYYTVDASYWGDYFTSFTGYLLWPM